jgi:hypothetical protein
LREVKANQIGVPLTSAFEPKQSLIGKGAPNRKTSPWQQNCPTSDPSAGFSCAAPGMAHGSYSRYDWPTVPNGANQTNRHPWSPYGLFRLGLLSRVLLWGALSLILVTVACGRVNSDIMKFADPVPVPANGPRVVMADMALLDIDKISLLRQISAIPMYWRIERRIDPDSGDRSCSVISRGDNVTVRLLKQQQVTIATWSVLVGFDNHPGSLRYLRINRNYYQTSEQGFRGPQATEIVDLMKSPGVIAFEWGKRPDYSKRQGLFGTGNFAARAAECEDWVLGRRV